MWLIYGVWLWRSIWGHTCALPRHSDDGLTTTPLNSPVGGGGGIGGGLLRFTSDNASNLSRRILQMSRLAVHSISPDFVAPEEPNSKCQTLTSGLSKNSIIFDHGLRTIHHTAGPYANTVVL